MRLIDFQIKNYKVIENADPVEADPRVTVVVGNNESGKTAVLQALWKSRNVSGARFDKLSDYPRSRYLQDHNKTQKVTILRFELSPEESKDFVAYLPQRPATKPTRIVYTTFYEGDSGIRSNVLFNCDLAAGASTAAARTAIETISSLVGTQQGEDVDRIISVSQTSLNRLETGPTIWEQGPISALETFAAAVTSWIEADPSRNGLAREERAHLAELIQQVKLGNPRKKAGEWAAKNLPIFIYFDDYGQLETRIHLPTYLAQKDSRDPKIRTQTALFEWIGIDPSEILSLGRSRQESENEQQFLRRHEKRCALLDSASFFLSDDWVTWWPEKRHKIHFDFDGENLILKVSDEYNKSPILLDERSRGFQWLFSFCLVFVIESKKAHKAAILLLDEPGLHLHPTLQAKLIHLFDHIAVGNQIIYSTHLPFLVDVHHLDRVRTIYLDGMAPKRTHISNDVPVHGDRDTLLPLQAAVSYSIAQQLRIGPRSVLLDDIVSYWIIRSVNDCLARLSVGPVLHEDTRLVPAGGVSGLMPLASIMLSSSGTDAGDMLVLVSDGWEGRDIGPEMNKVFQDSSVLMLNSPLGMAEATVEDLVPRDVYADAVGQAGFSLTFTEDERHAPTNLNAVKKAFRREGLGEFSMSQRASVTLNLVDGWARDPDTLPLVTQERACALFKAINTYFDNRSL